MLTRAIIFLTTAALGVNAYANTVLDPKHIENQVWATVWNPSYGLHVFALGANQSLFHKFQTSPVDNSLPMPSANMSKWHCLTPNVSMTFDTDPAAGINSNGQIELFSRFTGFIDLWQIYQEDPKDPLSWSKPREGCCMCAAVSPDDCPWCINCKKGDPCDANYFSDHAPFPTSAATVIMRPIDKKLEVQYRGFDGRMYSLVQVEAGNPFKYEPGPIYGPDSVFE